jgi:hypothetical protein
MVQQEFDLAKQTERQQDVISDVKAMLQHANGELAEHKQRLEAAEKQRDAAVADADQLTMRLIRMQEEQAAKMQALFEMEEEMLQAKKQQERGSAAARIDTSSVRELSKSSARSGSCCLPNRAARKTDAHTGEV